MIRYSAVLVLAWLTGAGFSAAWAQRLETSPVTLEFQAMLSQNGPPLASGLRWRLFAANPDSDGTHKLVAESTDARPTFTVPQGDYVAHVAFGLASAIKNLAIGGETRQEKIAITAGALRIRCTVGDVTIDPSHISLAIFVPERNNSTAKLVYAKARAGDVIGVPEGTYHVASTYLDTVGVGSLGVGRPGGAPVPTNSIAAGDVHVAAGKIVDLTLRLRFATLTIKLVNTPGAGALANTAFTVLTPGGDIVRELIGAFPSLVLAEGEYVVVARHDAKTYQATFTVQSGMDRDVEVLTREAAR